MSKKRPLRYDESFKRRAAEQVLLHHRPIAQVARQMGCSAQAVRNWVDQHRKSPTTLSLIQSPLPSSGQSSLCRTAFLPLQVEGTEMSSFGEARIEIITKNGLTLRFSGDTSPDLLIGIIQRLEVVPC